jgi:hypothetical protein
MHPDDYEQLLRDYLHPGGLDIDDFDSIEDAKKFIRENVSWAELPEDIKASEYQHESDICKANWQEVLNRFKKTFSNVNQSNL